MSKPRINPITLNFSTVKYYKLNPLLEVVRDPSTMFFDDEKSVEYFKVLAKNTYIPLLEFIQNQGIHANAIVSGNFLREAQKHSRKTLQLIEELIDSRQIQLVANAYYGNSLTSLYHSHWWSESVLRTMEDIEDIFDIPCEYAYLPQLFRGLEIERLSWRVKNFVSRHKEGKFTHIVMKDSELRRFNGQTVSWIREENDQECTYYFCPNNLFFDINEAFFEKNITQASKTISMKIGLAFAREQMRSRRWKPSLMKSQPRLNERYSLALYNPIQRAVIRLWEYASLIISSQYNNEPDTHSQHLFTEFAKLQDADYLYFLKKSSYQNLDIENFTSPYEAFINMQSTIKQIEILLKNRL